MTPSARSTAPPRPARARNLVGAWWSALPADEPPDTAELTTLDLEPEPAAAAAVFGEQLDQARRFAVLLAGEGVLRGLLGPREAARLWTRHLLNCGVVASLLPAPARVVDVGSGAGLPGIPIALARPACRVVLVEPLERRVRFLDEAVALLGLENVDVVRGRAEEVVARVGAADVVTSRAVAPLHRLVAWSAPLLRPGGVLLALKGDSARDELERDRAAVAAAGLRDAEVLQAGVGVVEPPTVVIRASRSRR